MALPAHLRQSCRRAAARWLRSYRHPQARPARRQAAAHCPMRAHPQVQNRWSQKNRQTLHRYRASWVRAAEPGQPEQSHWHHRQRVRPGLTP